MTLFFYYVKVFKKNKQEYMFQEIEHAFFQL